MYIKMKDGIIRVDKNFERKIREIARRRIINGADLLPRSSRRITLAITRHILFPQIEQDIINSDLKGK